MKNQEDIIDYLALCMIPGIGPRTARKILKQTGSPTAFFAERSQIQLSGVKPEHLTATAIDKYRKAAAKEINFALKESIQPLIPTDSGYPNRLKACDDAPLVLFTQGRMNLNVGRMVAVVGTRKASTYGQKVTEELIAEMAKYGCTLVSGLAYGIDSIAHKAALSADIQNLGVLAHGLDRLYPAVNKPLAEKMKMNGGLITDFPSGTVPDRENFPARNRIVAGLVDAVVVVEAAVSGGALITAEIAHSYNRDVFAIPGRWGDPFSEGCNRIISHNKAAILTNANDLAWNMGWTEKDLPGRAIQTQLFNSLEPDELKVVSQLQTYGQIDIDNLALALAFPVSKTSALLLGLEFKGIVRTLPGKIYQAMT